MNAFVKVVPPGGPLLGLKMVFRPLPLKLPVCPARGVLAFWHLTSGAYSLVLQRRRAHLEAGEG